MRTKTASKKWMIISAAVLLCASMFLSSFYTAAESGHECDDPDHCPVCACVSILQELSGEMAGRISKAPAVIICMISCLPFVRLITYDTKKTLVGLKIRLDY